MMGLVNESHVLPKQANNSIIINLEEFPASLKIRSETPLQTHDNESIDRAGFETNAENPL